MTTIVTPIEAWASQHGPPNADLSYDSLQESDDPIAELKTKGDKLAVVVPYEWNWPDSLAPMKNPKHKRFYDADLLAEHLEAAGYRGYVFRLVEFSGWSFLTAEAVRILNSKERRRLKRVNLQPGNRDAVEDGRESSDELSDNVGQKGPHRLDDDAEPPKPPQRLRKGVDGKTGG